MSGFYLHARPTDQGRRVRLHVHTQTAGGDPDEQLGTVEFAVDQWEAFRVMLVGGIRVAGFARIPISLNDGTRRRKLKPVG